MSTAVQVRRATESELAEIWHLTHDEYAAKGYIPFHPSRLYSHYTHLESIAETTPLIAIVDGDIVGTVTYTMDGPHKLHTDIDYPKETNIIRAIGMKLACSWRIVTASTVHSTHAVAHALMVETARQLVERGEPILLCTFNPHHAPYYAKRLGFRQIAERTESVGLANAPSVLMVGGPGTYSRLLSPAGQR